MSLKETLSQIFKKEPRPQAQATGGHFDFLEQIKVDYGITKVGERDFEVEVNGIKHVGTLSHIMSVAKGENDNIGHWGNP